MIQFACPYCQARLKCGDDKARTTLPCPGCRQIVEVPGTPRSSSAPQLPALRQPRSGASASPQARAAVGAIQRVCRHCGTAVQMDARMASQALACPSCHQVFDLPVATPLPSSQQPQVVLNVINAATAGSAVMPSAPELPAPPAWEPPSYRKRRKASSGWIAWTIGGAALVLVLGCGGLLAVVASRNVTNTAGPSNGAGAAVTKEPNQAEARDQLNRALTAWAAHTSKAALASKYPKLDFVDPDFTDDITLFRYDISNASWDPSDKRWTMRASLVFRRLQDDHFVRYDRDYYVTPPDERGVWRITVFMPGVSREVR